MKRVFVIDKHPFLFYQKLQFKKLNRLIRRVWDVEICEKLCIPSKSKNQMFIGIALNVQKKCVFEHFVKLGSHNILI